MTKTSTQTATKAAEKEEYRRHVAYHEAGHAIIAALRPGIGTLMAVNLFEGHHLAEKSDGTVIYQPPTGYRPFVPWNDQARNLIHLIDVALAGMFGEELVMRKFLSTGAKRDLQDAQRDAAKYVAVRGRAPRCRPDDSLIAHMRELDIAVTEKDARVLTWATTAHL
jgi:ATP-dependent Zn protease